jgi:hypothetical protein
MGEKVADLRVTGEGRLRYPWWQMQAGDWFDVTVQADPQMQGLRNALSSAIAGMRKRTGMNFMQRTIEDKTIRVFRIDGHTFGLSGTSRTLSYTGDDPLGLATAKNGVVKKYRVDTEAEMEYMIEAAKRSKAVGEAEAIRRHWAPIRIDINPDREAMVLWVRVVQIGPTPSYALQHVPSYVEEDALKLCDMKAGTSRSLTFGSEGEFEATMSAINVSLSFAAARTDEKVRYEVTTSKEAGIIFVKCVGVSDEQAD